MNKRNRMLAVICTLCVVMGSVVPITSYAGTEREIIKQPTPIEPSVVVSDEEEASYQWYYSQKNLIATMARLTGKIVDDKILVDTHSEFGREEEGIWHSGNNNISIEMKLEEGDTIKCIPSKGFTGQVILPHKGMILEADANGVYSYTTVGNDTTVGDELSIKLVVEDEAEFTCEVYVQRGANTYTAVQGSKQICDGQISSFLYFGSFSGSTWESIDSELVIETYVKAGQVILISPSETFEGNVTVIRGGEKITGTYFYEAEESGFYTITMTDSCDFTADIGIYEYVLGKPVEGQTTNTLTEAENREVYACKVTYPDKEELISSFVEVEYAITKQPTAGNLTVGVNFAKGASYQWYNVEDAVFNVIDKDMSAGKLEENISYVFCGNYDSTEGVWYGQYLDLELKLDAGETVLLTPSDGFKGTVYVCFTDESFEEKEGVYTYTAPRSGNYEVMVTLSEGESEDDISAKLQVQKTNITDAIEGENLASLKGGECDKKYACRVNWKNGCSITSDIVTLKTVITTQPTVGSAAIEVNFPNEVSSYQWYEFDKNTLGVEYYAGLLEDGVYYADASCGSYADGTWRSENLNIQFSLNVEAGDIIEIAPEKDTDVSKFQLVGYTIGNGTIEEKNGGYICKIEEDDASYYLLFRGEEEYSLTAKITKADGKVYDVQKYDFETNNCIKNNVCFGAYEDGRWISRLEYGKHRIELELEVKEGDFIIMRLPKNFKGGVYEYNIISGSTELEGENGVFIYKAGKDEETDITMISETAFSAEIEVERYTMKDALKGQNKAVLTTDKPGIYACVITLKDGTRIVSDRVILTEADVLPPNEKPTIPNKGDNMAVCLGFVMTGICMAGIGFVLRRRVRY